MTHMMGYVVLFWVFYPFEVERPKEQLLNVLMLFLDLEDGALEKPVFRIASLIGFLLILLLLICA